nr:hypothetical protein [Tanacetum cinerariifolium]
MASAIICLATGRKFNFSKYIFDSLVRNVDSSSKLYIHPRFLQLMIAAQVGDLSSHTTKYTSPALTQKVFANMRSAGKGFSGVDTPLFEGMLVPQQAADDVDDVVVDDIAVDVVADVDTEPTPPLPTPTTTPPPQQEVTSTPPPLPHQFLIAKPSSPPPQQQPSHDATISIDLLNTLLETYTTLTRKVKALEQDKIAKALEITKLKQRVRRLGKKNKLKVSGLKRLRKDVTLEEVDAARDAEVAKDADVLSMQDDEAKPTELNEVIKVVTTTKLMTEVVTAASTSTATPMPTASAARRKKGVVIRDPEDTSTPSIIVLFKPKSKDKGKGIKVKRKEKQDNEVFRYHALNRKPQIEAQARKNMMHFNSNMAFLEKGEEKLEEEVSKALKRKSKNDVYTEATPLALKVPVIDYQIHTEHNKPYYKIIRADETHQLFLSFISLLRNFDREDLEMLWQIIQERFASSKPKNFSNDFLLNALKTMFESLMLKLKYGRIKETAMD